MTIELLMQPKGSNQCGQHVMAMLTKLEVNEVIKLYGTDNSTNPRMHIKVLNELGYIHSGHIKVDNRKKDVLKPIHDVGTAFIRIKFGNSSNGHIMLYKDGKVYDSSNGVYDSIEHMLNDYNDRHSRKVRINYYILIYGKDNNYKL